MKRIRIKFVECEWLRKMFLPYLQSRFEVEETDSPDFAIFSDESKKKCVYYNCIRVLFIGENNRPDFNLFDYAIGFDDLQFGDRYLHAPLYTWPFYRHRYLRLAMDKKTNPFYSGAEKSDFCGFLVSNGNNASPVRDLFFDMLSEYKKVNSGGKYRNNMPDGKAIPTNHELDFISKQKFMIAFENSTFPGYTTEKIINAWAGGAIPIYWGDPDIKKVFNEKAFIEVRGNTAEAVQEAIDRVILIDRDREQYQKMLNEPILCREKKVPPYFDESYISEYLYHIMEQSVDKALRRTNVQDGWGAYYEKDYYRYVKMDESPINHFIYRKLLKL